MDLNPIGEPPASSARWCPSCQCWLESWEHQGRRRCFRCGTALVRPTALDTERRMAKADLVAREYTLKDITGVIDVALVPIVQPPGYLPWLDGLRANAAYGSDALARAWYVSPVNYIQHLITVAPDLWTTLQAIARRRVA